MSSFICLNRLLEKEAAEKPDLRERLRREGRVLLSWARQLSDAALIEKLGGYSLEIDPPTLQQWAASAGSAEEIARSLKDTGRLKMDATGQDLDWAWAALTVLWERWMPDSPSFEMLDDGMQEGYALEQGRARCLKWLETWQHFLRVFQKLQTDTIENFDRRFQGTQMVYNWVQDLEMELGDLARPKQDREWFQRRIQFCEEFLARFANEDRLLVENMRRGLAESVFGLGETNRANELFRNWLTENPRWSWGWIAWADCYLFSPPPRQDLRRAEELFQQGLAIDGIEDKDVFYERLEHLYEEQGRNDKSAEMRAALDKLKTGTSAAAPIPVRRPAPKVGRNDPCPCGSGKKFKKCCGG